MQPSSQPTNQLSERRRGLISQVAIALARVAIRTLWKLVRRPSQVQWLAVALVVIALVAGLLWYSAPAANSAPAAPPPSTWERFLQAWMPNLGTSAAIVALTLFLFEPALKRHEQARKRRQIVPILQQIGMHLQDFAEAAAFDYDQTHEKSQLPLEIRDPHWLVARWQKGLDTEDSDRDWWPSNVPAIINAATLLSRELDELEQRHGHELDDAGLPELKCVIRAFVKGTQDAAIYAQRVNDLLLTTTDFDDPNLRKLLVLLDETEKDLLPRVAKRALALADIWDRQARPSAGSAQRPTEESWTRRVSLRKRRLALKPPLGKYGEAKLSIRSEHDYKSCSSILANAEQRVDAARRKHDIWSRGLPAEQAEAAKTVSDPEQSLEGGLPAEQADTAKAVLGAEKSLEGLRGLMSDFIETRDVYLDAIATERQQLADAGRTFNDASSRDQREDAKEEVAFLKRSLADLLEAAERSGFRP